MKFKHFLSESILKKTIFVYFSFIFLDLCLDSLLRLRMAIKILDSWALLKNKHCIESKFYLAMSPLR